MTTSIQFVKMPTSPALTNLTEKKLKKLATRYSWLMHVEVSYKLESDFTGLKVCEMELSVPGPKIFATSKAPNFELALKNTLSDVARQLRRRKEKAFNH